jgi:hypothetical protein
MKADDPQLAGADVVAYDDRPELRGAGVARAGRPRQWGRNVWPLAVFALIVVSPTVTAVVVVLTEPWDLWGRIIVATVFGVLPVELLGQLYGTLRCAQWWRQRGALRTTAEVVRLRGWSALGVRSARVSFETSTGLTLVRPCYVGPDIQLGQHLEIPHRAPLNPRAIRVVAPLSRAESLRLALYLASATALLLVPGIAAGLLA